MITRDSIDAKIQSSTFIVMPDGRTTVCQIILENGFSVIGTSSCVEQEDFNIIIGRDIAYKDAFEKIWELEGYLAMQQKNTPPEPTVVVTAKDEPTYGYKLDGSPRAKPGRKAKKSRRK